LPGVAGRAEPIRFGATLNEESLPCCEVFPSDLFVRMLFNVQRVDEVVQTDLGLGRGLRFGSEFGARPLRLRDPPDIEWHTSSFVEFDLGGEGVPLEGRGTIQAQLRSAEPLESTDGTDVQDATAHLFRQDAAVRDQEPDEPIVDYLDFLDEAGQSLVDTMQVTPANDGEVIFRDLPLVDDAEIPLVYTLQISEARTEVRDPDNPGMTRIVHFAEAAVPNLMAEEGDPVTTQEIRLIPFDGFEVNSTGDAPDLDQEDGVCDTGELQSEGRPECTLRAAIEQANQREGRDLISFNIPGPPPHTIAPASRLPAIEDAVLIDGNTQPGLDPGLDPGDGDVVAFGEPLPDPEKLGTRPRLMSARRAMSVGMQPGVPDDPKITLDGTNAGPVHGYDVKAMNVWIRGKRIVNYLEAGIRLSQESGKVTITGTIIGIGNDGTAQENGWGILVLSPGNTIGGATQTPGKAPGNVISGNLRHGIELSTLGADRNTVAGNIIGLDPAGREPMPNGAHGVALLSAGILNKIGGNRAGEGNIITGNLGHGISLEGGGAQ